MRDPVCLRAGMVWDKPGKRSCAVEALDRRRSNPHKPLERCGLGQSVVEACKWGRMDSDEALKLQG